MVSTKYIQDKKTGKMLGSAGTGRDTVPPVAPTTTAATTTVVDDTPSLSSVLASVAPATRTESNSCLFADCTRRCRTYKGICNVHRNALVKRTPFDGYVDSRQLDLLMLSVEQHPGPSATENLLVDVLLRSQQPLTRDQVTWLCANTDSQGVPWTWHMYLSESVPEVVDHVVAEMTLEQLMAGRFPTGSPFRHVFGHVLHKVASRSPHADVRAALIAALPDHPDLATSLAHNPHMTAADIAALAAAAPSRMYILAEHPNVPSQLLTYWLRNPDIYHLSWEQQRDLVLAVADNDNADAVALRAAARLEEQLQDGDWYPTAGFVLNPNTPTDVLDHIYAITDTAVFLTNRASYQQHLSVHPNISAGVREALADVPPPAPTGTVRVPLNRNAARGRLTYLLTDPVQRQTAERLLNDGWTGTFDELVTAAELL